MPTKKVSYSCLVKAFSINAAFQFYFIWCDWSITCLLEHYIFAKALDVFYFLKIDTIDINTYDKCLGEAPSNSDQVMRSLLSELCSDNLIAFDGTALLLEWSTPITRRKKRRWESNLVFLVSSMGLSPSFASMIKLLWVNYFLFPPKSYFPDDFRGNKNWSICSNSLNKGIQFWRQSLINSIQQFLIYEIRWLKNETEAKTSSSKL